MTLDVNADARVYRADAMTGGEVLPDVDSPAQSQVKRLVIPPDAQASQAAQQAEYAARLEGLETVARAALDAVTTDAGNRLSQAVDAAETRVMDALSLLEQHQRETARWRTDLDERLRTQMRELGEWDETLTEMRHEVGGLREMAEASVSLASGDLDKRWDAVQRELRDILATAESDERARWEAFMAGATETLAGNSGIDPAELASVRGELATLRESATTTISQLQQVQREQLAALRSEINTLVESERNRISAGVAEQLDEARQVFVTQTQSLQDWQSQVGRDVSALKDTAVAAEAGVRHAKTSLHTETQSALTTIRSEVDLGVAQARTAAQSENVSLRTDMERLIKRSQGAIQGRQSLSLLLALLSLLLAIAALALPFVLHTH